jgi:hypothetical protein
MHYYYCDAHIAQGHVGIVKVVSCEGDIDGNGLINVNDFLELNTNFGLNCGACLADLDDNGFVNVNDFLILNSAFGSACQ